MNHGKLNNNTKESSLDRVNKFLARLMGKKEKQQQKSPQPENTPSDSKFMLIIVAAIVILWGVTGLYYVPKGSIGIIAYNGKVAKIISGMEIGITRPFPFSDLTIIDNDNDNTAFSIGKESDNTFNIVTNDAKNMRVVAEVDYSFKNPTLYFQTFYQDDDELDTNLAWITEAYIQDSLKEYTESEVLSASKLILANEISAKLNQLLTKNGLVIDKLNIIALTGESNNQTTTTSNASSLAESIIVEANRYALDKANQTNVLSKDYDSLLAQYKANSRLVEDLLYYRMLSQIPESANQDSYPLLNLTKADFINLVNNKVGPARIIANKSSSSVLKNDNPRALERSVVRERIFLDR